MMMRLFQEGSSEPTYQPSTFQLPEQMSTSANHVDWLYYFIYWLSVVLFVAIIGAMCWFAYKYRARKGHKAEPTGHNVPLEIAWTVAPIVILVLLFHWGFKGYMDLSIAPADAMEIRVNAKQWGWEFVYPSGDSDNELHVPIGKPVKLIMSSSDVLHAFYVPALRVKRDVVPGMYTSLWFKALGKGERGYDDIFCAEYCGGKSKLKNPETGESEDLPENAWTGHWNMHSIIHFDTQEEFDKYLEKIGVPVGGSAQQLAEFGGKLRMRKNCVSCHSVDGSKGAGPSWKGIWGKQEETDHGTVTVDETYVRESILTPQAKIVRGYGPTMPTFQGQIKDKEIDAIIAYLKSLK